MRFTKMQGCGNDYVYVDCVRNPPPRHAAELSRKVSDRHFGIGADGLILIGPSERADVRMRMFNADGSEAEMCGNGIRCVAKYAYDHGLTRNNPLTVETGRGILTLRLHLKAGRVERVTVNMGEPILEADKVPTTLPGPRVVDAPLPLQGDDLENTLFGGCGLDPRITCVSMGNPHVVLYCRDVGQVPLERVGPVLETLPCFPRRVNVHFVQVQSAGEAILRTWERGSGVTLACGTGACAVAVAGVLTGR
ncbi:MAG TPA: diaminopimelate epimerase, partial [Gemmataceae bacterium]|nr:diaminopimelate epimerase [Gemmataceae bacterium]